MNKLLALTLLSASAAATPLVKRQHGNATTTYDYIVVGGGTAGLAVANRLSEDPSVSVLVIEAGGSVYDNPNVTTENSYGLALGTDIDYAYPTVNQTYAGDTVKTMSAGKALGGTSTINGMAYTRAEIAQINAWETLGNEGWNWDSLFPYYKKSESFQAPDAERATLGHITYNTEYHGEDGPLIVGWAYDSTNDSYTTAINATYQALGVEWNNDVNGGSMVGLGNYPKTFDPYLQVRTDAARTYYYPYQNRTNLVVRLNTTANRVTWASTSNTTLPTASGVEITAQDGTVSTVHATKEVILSAGALVSPQLLELSGVGNPTILSKFGIDTVVDLPTVGENLQDQVNNGLLYNLSSNVTYDSAAASLVAYPSAAQVFGEAHDAVAAELQASLAAYADATALGSGNVTRAADLLEFFQLQYDLIFEQEIPVAEILIYISSGEWSSQYWGLLPFSRGSVHIGSGKATSAGVINPNYFQLPYDGVSHFQIARFIRDVFATGPFAALVADEVSPGLDVVGAAADDGEWQKWVFGTYRSNYHPVATAAMMPREKGGVVDAELKVYGTANLRVVDASVLPFQVCGHLVSTLYAVAEKAADLIKASA